jgi:hypothetical protein
MKYLLPVLLSTLLTCRPSCCFAQDKEEDWVTIRMPDLGFEASFPLIPIETKTMDGEAIRYRFENFFTKGVSPNRFYQLTVWVPNDPADSRYATIKMQEIKAEWFKDKPELISQNTMHRGGTAFVNYVLKNKKNEYIHCCVGSSDNKVYELQIATKPDGGINYESLAFLRAFDLIRAKPLTVAFNPDSLSYSIDFPYTPYVEIENLEVSKIASAVAMPPRSISDEPNKEEYKIIWADSIFDLSEPIVPYQGKVAVWEDSIYDYVVSEVAFKAALEATVSEWRTNNGEVFYSGLVQSVLSEQGGELVGQEYVKVGNVHGISFHIKNFERGRTYICRAFLGRSYLYQIMVTGGVNVTPDTPIVARFMNSFRIK